MPEELTNDQVEETMQDEPHGEPEQKHETDWKSEARKWEKRAKASSDAQQRLDELKSQVDALNERAEKAEKEASDLRKKNEMEEWKAAASIATGVPASLIHGTTAEEMMDSANAIKGYVDALPIHPTIGAGSGSNAAPVVTRESIMAIANEKERLAAIKSNMKLFE